MTQPLVSDWAEAGFEVTVAALANIAPIYSAMQGVAHVLEWTFKRKKLQLTDRVSTARMLAGHYSAAVIAPNSFKSAIIPLIANIPRRIGYTGEMRGFMLTHALANPHGKSRGSMVQFYRALGPHIITHKTSKESSQEGMTPKLSFASKDIEQSTKQFGVSVGGYTVIAPGAEYGEAKRWPSEYYAQVVSKLIEQRGGYSDSSLCGEKAVVDPQILILGTAADHGIAEQIMGEVCSKNKKWAGLIKDLTGKTQLLQAAQLIAGARALISNDSGLMHIGAALHKPQVAIFGSSSPKHTPALNNRAQMLWHALECAPCYERVCPLGHLKCLKGIGIDEVVKAYERCLAA